MHTPKLAMVALVTLAAMALGHEGYAQQPPTAPTKSMTTMDMPTAPGSHSAAPSPMMESMEKMSKDMAAVPVTGNADADFVGMMIPHHQGAIDMARYELANGKDPAMRKMAREVIAAQEKEIATMKSWQAKHSASR